MQKKPIKFSKKAAKDFNYWKTNRKILAKIAELIEDISLQPFSGLGKPEALKHNKSGRWSRRIDQKNRIEYEVFDAFIFIHSLEGHYE